MQKEKLMSNKLFGENQQNRSNSEKVFLVLRKKGIFSHGLHVIGRNNKITVRGGEYSDSLVYKGTCP